MAQAAADQLDEVVALFDQAVSARESRAKSKTDEALVERAKKGEARRLLMDVILPVLTDPSIADDEVGGMLRERIGMQRLREITSDAWKPLPRDYGRLSELESSYTYLRQFIPNVLAAIDFQLPFAPIASRQNTLAAALKEWGMLRRTVHLAKYLSDPAFSGGGAGQARHQRLAAVAPRAVARAGNDTPSRPRRELGSAVMADAARPGA